jgi:hypothetical protein
VESLSPLVCPHLAQRLTILAHRLTLASLPPLVGRNWIARSDPQGRLPRNHTKPLEEESSAVSLNEPFLK